MGMLELFESITNYPLYQKGIIALNYLLYRIIGTSDDFITKLFTISSKPDLFYNKDRIKETLLSSIQDKDKQNKIIDDPTYGLDKGFLKWAELIGKDEKIKQATWLQDILGLTDAEISLLLGKNSFLNSYLMSFNEKLRVDLNCPQTPCGNEIIFLQLQNQIITKSIGFNNIKQLNEHFDKIAFPYEHSVEMSYFFEIYKKQHPNVTYANIELSKVQFEKLFNEKSDGFILNTNNAINLIEFNATHNLYLAYNSFLLKSIDQMTFLTDYLFDFLPNNLLYGMIPYGEKVFHIEPLSKGYVSLMQILIDSTYGKLAQKNYLMNLLYSFVLDKHIKEGGIANICPRILQLALGDPMRVLKICRMKEYDMTQPISLRKWIHGFLCKINNCKEGIIEEITKTLEITDGELDKIYTSDYLGEYLIPVHKEITDHYQCTKSCSNEDFVNKQYVSGSITKNPPESIKDMKSDSIYEWDKNTFKKQIEIFYYTKKTMCPESDCNENSIKELISLYQLSENLLSGTNPQQFYTKNLLEKIHSLLLNDIEASTYSENINIKNSRNFFKVIDVMIKTILFQEHTMSTYQAEEILYGNGVQDNTYIDILRKGSPIDNYKPAIQKLTGFNIEIVDDEQTTKNYPSCTIQTSQNDKTQILRRLIKMNNTPFISINKLEYSMTKNEMIPIHTPLYNFYAINKDKWMSDGFQFDAGKERIYYYDEMSSRVLQFDYKMKRNFGNIYCYEYILNSNLSQGIMEKNDINNSTIGFASERFNKPFVVSSMDYYTNQSITNMPPIKESNICVDPYSNMVVESDITLVYSIYTKNYNILDPSLAQNDMIPLILYKRHYNISDLSTYKTIFPDVLSYFAWRMALILIGCGFILCFFALGVFYLIKHRKQPPHPKVDLINDLFIPKSF